MGFGNKIKNAIKRIVKMPKKYIVTIILGVMVIITGTMAIRSGNLRRPLNYPSSLDVVAITVGDTEITLRDMAFYVAYEEMEVEKQAVVYDPEDPNKYWNIHTDGEFVKVAAKNAAIQMAIHDQIFCQMAEADGVTLEASDYEYIRNSESDFISDLEDYEGLEKLGVTEEDICNSMERVALAQKYQQMYAEMNGENMEAYDFTGDAYKELVEKNYEYKIKEKIWERIRFGNVILEH